MTPQSRSFEQIKAAYAENPDATALEDPGSRNADGDTLLHLAALRAARPMSET